MEHTILTQKPALQMQFMQYLKICNDALLINGNRYPYKQIWDAANVHTLRLKICTVITDNDQSYEAVTILKDGELSMMPETCCGCSKCYGEERHWRLSAQEIMDATHHRDLYVAQPGRLNWEWLLPPAGYLSAQGKPELHAEQA